MVPGRTAESLQGTVKHALRSYPSWWVHPAWKKVPTCGRLGSRARGAAVEYGHDRLDALHGLLDARQHSIHLQQRARMSPNNALRAAQPAASSEGRRASSMVTTGWDTSCEVSWEGAPTCASVSFPGPQPCEPPRNTSCSPTLVTCVDAAHAGINRSVFERNVTLSRDSVVCTLHCGMRMTAGGLRARTPLPRAFSQHG